VVFPIFLHAAFELIYFFPQTGDFFVSGSDGGGHEDSRGGFEFLPFGIVADLDVLGFEFGL
jgi:hypothetical protein